ncbi:MAG: SIMPL domain-containing protein [Chloroflexi bacterium]|nr:SIMPL domain-containing protein [Chloroflexota bacterium]
MWRIWQGVIAGLLVVCLGVAAAMVGRSEPGGPFAAVQPLVPRAQAETSVNGSATNTPAPDIVVTGEGSASAAPDVAYLTFGVVTQAATAASASSENAHTMSTVIAALKAQGIDAKDIRTLNYSIEPEYSRGQNGAGTPKITGYSARNSVQVTARNVSKAAAVLDAGVMAGANSSVSIQFGIADPTALQLQALKAAMAQARAKADAIAAAAGVKITGIINVSEQSSGGPRPVSSIAPMAASTAVRTPVEVGTQQVTSRVAVTFAYSQ